MVRYGEVNRSWGFHLHAFEFMDPLLREYSATGERLWLDTAVAIALDWLGIYLGPTPPEDSMAGTKCRLHCGLLGYSIS